MTGFRNDSYMEARLGRWGMYKRWHRRTASPPIGMPMSMGDGSWWGPLILDAKVQVSRSAVVTLPDPPCPVDREEAQETERCVAVLPEKLRNVITETYIRGGTIDHLLKHLHCSRWSYYTWLYQAYDQLMGYMNDVACGVPLPPLADGSVVAA